MDAIITGGAPWVKATTFSTASSGKRTPRARPTAATSAEARANSGAMSGSSRSMPIGVLVAAVSAELVASRMNFIQSSVTIWSLCVASKPAFWHSARKVSPRALLPTFQFAEYQAHEAAGLPDHPRFGDGGADLRDSAHHRRRTEDWDQAIGRIDAVLQRDHRRCRANQRRDGCAGGLDIPQLDAEQYEINRPDGRRIIGSLRRGDQGFAAAALDAQAVRAHGLQMGAASNESNVGTGFCQGGPNAPPTPPAPITAIRIGRTPYLDAAETFVADRQRLSVAFKLSLGEGRVKQNSSVPHGSFFEATK